QSQQSHHARHRHELEINAGDDILVKHVFEDGRVFGKNLSQVRGNEGVFPVACLMKAKVDIEEIAAVKKSGRFGPPLLAKQ
ncbi:hypothetical protein HDU98_007699, partial [Podochytrium sp. JEL0797]